MEIVCYKFSNSSVFFTPYCRARKDFSERVWVVALIVNRFRDKREKKTHFTTFELCTLDSKKPLFNIQSVIGRSRAYRHLTDFWDGFKATLIHGGAWMRYFY